MLMQLVYMPRPMGTAEVPTYVEEVCPFIFVNRAQLLSYTGALPQLRALEGLWNKQLSCLQITLTPYCL